MPLSPGTRVGSYEITASIGAGGMGEVYRARDSKLKRDVAIKVLPEDVANDPERLARFQREAEVLASLNHPHIAQVYGFENPSEAGHHTAALVMELVEGEDLAERLRRGPIPVDEALPIARQIAEALEAAHDAGIIHRDLKPANVKVRRDGTVKILDFGLAKALSQDLKTPGPQDLANSPTITSPAMTVRGTILGTAAYMSPEQAKGKSVDKRADVWAFGCVLYEMLAGKKAFVGDDVTDTLTAVMRDTPDWRALPFETPSAVRTLLRRCLEKDPRKRIPHMAIARMEIDDATTSTGELIHMPSREPSPVSARTVAAVAIVAGSIALIGGWALGRSMAPEPVADSRAVRFTIEPPEGSLFPGAASVPRFALSHDGRRIAYQLQDSKSTRLWIRSLDSLELEPVAGNESLPGGPPGAATQAPFWSPDGRFVAFFDEGTAKLKKLDLRTTLTEAVTDVVGSQMAGTWSRDNVILFSAIATEGIWLVRPDGTGLRQVTTVDTAKKEVTHLWPEFFHDGRHFTFLVTFSDNTPSALHLASIDGSPPKRLFESPTGARSAWPDRLLVIRDNALVSQRFDVNTMQLIGEAEVISDDVPFTPAGRIGASSATGANVIAYSSGGTIPLGEGFITHWVDRLGVERGGAPPPVVASLNGVRLSPGGRTLVYARGFSSRRGAVETSIWLQDTSRGIETQHSTDATPGAHAIVSPDGSRMIYRRLTNSKFSLRMAPLSGATTAEDVFTNEFGGDVVPFDWTRRDEIVLFIGSRTLDRSNALWYLPLAGNRRPIRYLDGDYRLGTSLSPDGRWLAYAAGATPETAQVFIQSFPDPKSGRWPVSAIGGTFPRWRADGRELFFVDSRRRLMAATMSTSPQVQIGTATALFALDAPSRSASLAYPYDVMPDGKRFVTLRSRGLTPRGMQLIVDVR